VPKSRKRRRNVNEWKWIKCKCHRNSGRQYKSVKSAKIVPAKEVGASCRCKNACWNRLKDSVESIFHSFWDQLTLIVKIATS
jgi:hypothetical protein